MRPPAGPAWRSPPFALAAACCAWPPSAGRDARLRALCAGPAVDWEAFARLCGRHRIEGLAHASLGAAGVRPPPGMAAELAARARQIAANGLALAAESHRLQGRLDGAGLANLVLKGAALEVLAYGRLGLKSAWDIDLLVAETDILAAEEVLEAAGYRLASPTVPLERWAPFAKEAVFLHGASGAVVELHWRLVDNPALLPGLGPHAPSQEAPIGGQARLRTLAADELIAYLCVHGASHGWSRLKWLADLAALLSREDADGLRRLFDRSQALGAGACAGQALLLCQRLLGLDLPADLALRLRRDPKVGWLERSALWAMAGGGGAELAGRPLASEAVLATHLLFGHGWAWRWGELRRQWVSVHDRSALALPRGLVWLYHLLRAPSWLIRRLVRRPGRRVRASSTSVRRA